MLNEYHNAIRQTIDLAKRRGKSDQLYFYQVNEDEIHDAPLVSPRVYGARIYADVVRVACGVSYVSQPLPIRAIYLPVIGDILKLKKKYGVV